MKQLAFCWPEGKTGALTTSWDDGGVADRQLVSILNTVGLKGTWNLNSGRLGPDTAHTGWGDRVSPEEVRPLYAGHEVAVHSVTHPSLVGQPDRVVFSEVIEDRRRLENLVDYPVTGMALPFGTLDKRVRRVLRQCGIHYARTVEAKTDFQLPVDFLNWQPTSHHASNLDRLWAEFKVQPAGPAKLFYLWGHSWEFEGEKNWAVIEKFAAMAGADVEIWHATNAQIYAYATAWRSLVPTVEMTAILNPSSVTVWFRAEGELRFIEPGQLVQLGA